MYKKSLYELKVFFHAMLKLETNISPGFVVDIVAFHQLSTSCNFLANYSQQMTEFYSVYLRKDTSDVLEIWHNCKTQGGAGLLGSMLLIESSFSGVSGGKVPHTLGQPGNIMLHKQV